MFLRFVCHLISGAVIFANLEQFVAFGASWVGRPWLYSLCYNGAYMLPELVITMVAATILFRLPQIRRIMANETVKAAVLLKYSRKASGLPGAFFSRKSAAGGLRAADKTCYDETITKRRSQRRERSYSNEKV
mgnify:CR=1 FL=1